MSRSRARSRSRGYQRAMPFNPLHLGSQLKLWLRDDMGITLGGTPLATGTTPPVVTIATTDGVNPYGFKSLRIEITTGGARGTALFRWSTDDGTTWQATGVTTAATVALSGMNCTITFPVGAYTNDNVYRATLATWANQGAAGGTFTQATAANQPLSLPTGIDFDGTNDRMTSTNALSTIIANNAYTALFVGYERTFSNNATSYLNDPWITDTGGYFVQVFKDPGTKSAITMNYDGTVDVATATTLAASALACVEARHDANTITARVDNGTEASAVSGNTQVLTGTLIVGSVYDQVTNFWDGVIREIIVCNTVLSAADKARLRQYLGYRYGLAIS